ELPEAERVYEEALAIYKSRSDKMKVALLLRNIGGVYSLQGRNDEAQRALQEALKIVRADPKPDQTFIEQMLKCLGVEYYRQGNMKKAEQLCTQALAKTSGDAYNRADLLNNLGAVYHVKREFQKAEEYLKQALKVTEARVGFTHPDLTFS